MVIKSVAIAEDLLQAIAAKSCKGDVELAPGIYELGGSKVVVEFDEGAKILKSPDEEYIPTTSISMLAVLAVFSKQAGVQREHLLSVLRESMTAALVMDDSSKEYIAAFEKDYKTAEDTVKLSLAALPKAKRKGKLTLAGLKGKVKVTTFSGPALAAASATVPVSIP